MARISYKSKNITMKWSNSIRKDIAAGKFQKCYVLQKNRSKNVCEDLDVKP